MATFNLGPIDFPDGERLRPLEIRIEVKGGLPHLSASVLPIAEGLQQVDVLVDWQGTSLAPQVISLDKVAAIWRQHFFLILAIAGATAVRAIPGLAAGKWRSVSLHMQDLDHGEDDEIIVTIDSTTWTGKLTTNHVHRRPADLEIDSSMHDWNAGAILAEITSRLVLSEPFFHKP